MPKLIQYRDKCIGCGICHQLQPAWWRMSKRDGKATLVKGEKKNQTYVREIPQDEEGLARRVVRDCPVRIIKWI